MEFLVTISSSYKQRRSQPHPCRIGKSVKSRAKRDAGWRAKQWGTEWILSSVGVVPWRKDPTWTWNMNNNCQQEALYLIHIRWTPCPRTNPNQHTPHRTTTSQCHGCTRRACALFYSIHPSEEPRLLLPTCTPQRTPSPQPKLTFPMAEGSERKGRKGRRARSGKGEVDDVEYVD